MVDASVALAWVIPDERTAATDGLLMTARSDGIVVPTMWTYEVANALTLSLRRGRLGRDSLDDAFAVLGALPTVAIPDPGVERLARLAVQTGLTAYDAGYIWVAEREALPLATFDGRIRDAASARGITVLL
ncbi:type II toxin-antitoxin system VapC family toxin [Nocardioides baekrokdamisoli]|uniref:type II toxin-antitoxin system VapC family toxin n=1 Tax=Nocardioides baekrokdamisoli TaxID=1804624 RepID=UPI0018D50DDC|nr:type II toxin-antitoxin system VapC family toxin [Nocardioides baekrokdamisoli]